MRLQRARSPILLEEEEVVAEKAWGLYLEDALVSAMDQRHFNVVTDILDRRKARRREP